MLEVIEGKGRLEATTPPEKIWEVSYRFEFTTRIVKKPGLPRVASKGENRGVVESLDGKPIPEGDYQLQTEDGEILHVQNVGLGNWMIPRTRVRVLKRVLEAAYFAHLAHVHTLKTQEFVFSSPGCFDSHSLPPVNQPKCVFFLLSFAKTSPSGERKPRTDAEARLRSSVRIHEIASSPLVAQGHFVNSSSFIPSRG
jgi:hypothetical protein